MHKNSIKIDQLFLKIFLEASVYGKFEEIKSWVSDVRIVSGFMDL